MTRVIERSAALTLLVAAMSGALGVLEAFLIREATRYLPASVANAPWRSMFGPLGWIVIGLIVGAAWGLAGAAVLVPCAYHRRWRAAMGWALGGATVKWPQGCSFTAWPRRRGGPLRGATPSHNESRPTRCAAFRSP